MDSWVVGQLAFWYTVYEISPTMVVDKLVQFWLDVTVPGRGVGGSNWFMKQLRTIEQTTERSSRELDVRRNLRSWDDRYPEIHHELIVRYVAGALVSVVATSFYNSLRRPSRPRHSYY